MDESVAASHFVTNLEDLAEDCVRYQSIAKANSLTAGSGRTKLDKERFKLCLSEIVSLSFTSDFPKIFPNN